MANDKVLVVGGAGFIGSHVVDNLVFEGRDVVVLDNLATGHLDNINSKAKFIQADASNEDIVYDALDGVSSLVFLAAHASVIGSLELHYNKNVVPLLNTLKACERRALSHIVFTTSAAAVDPVNPYGTTKLISEALIKEFDRDNQSAVILRLANVYGPRQKYNVGGPSAIVPVMRYFLERDQAIPVHGDGTQKRDLVYVEDVVNTLTWYVRNKHRNISYCNYIGTGITLDMFTIAAILARAYAKTDYTVKITNKDSGVKDPYIGDRINLETRTLPEGISDMLKEEPNVQIRNT